ncbi:hypothetical protein [Nocardia pseudovaccinii]|uniref:hypothetical protein n=1 Tax=Nocardia pseudovaccinii TaxID=189540 RepID=UPI0007A4EABE|nr:hypothetical protein [Nocardia pseudovaccinii]
MIDVVALAVTGVLTLAGLRDVRSACAAVAVAAVTLVLLDASPASFAVAGLGSTVYLVGTQMKWTPASIREIGAGTAGAVAFSAIALLADVGAAHLPWIPVIAPVAALVVIVVPLRAIRSATSTRDR